MKLIIDIPEKAYRYILKYGIQDTYEINAIIANGKSYEERQQGEWVYRKEWFENEPEERMAWGCSSCGFSIQNSHDKQNYCPNCGSDMRGKEQ